MKSFIIYEKTFLKIDCFMKENGRENLEPR